MQRKKKNGKSKRYIGKVEHVVKYCKTTIHSLSFYSFLIFFSLFSPSVFFFFFCVFVFFSRKKRESAESSSDEEEEKVRRWEIEEAMEEARELERQRAKAEGKPLAVQTKIQTTFDHDATVTTQTNRERAAAAEREQGKYTKKP